MIQIKHLLLPLVNLQLTESEIEHSVSNKKIYG